MLSLIAAIARNHVIGKDGGLPWHLPDDLAHFKRTTLGKPVLMGRRTYEEVGRPLPGRDNWVVTRRSDFRAPGCHVVASLDEALAATADAPERIVIGGAQLYAAALPRVDRLYITWVHADVEGDVRFPPLDLADWNEVEREEHPADERHAHAFSIVTYERSAPGTSLRYRPRPRPEWVRGANEMGRAIDAKSVVPLDETSLLQSAMQNTGLCDFGDDRWREPFRILLDDLENVADLHLVGRLMTRSDLLIHLEGRLQVIDWLKRHPEVEDEVIEAPVFVVGLPRSGTTIMEEILGADPRARSVRMWEAKFPCPPPRPDDPKPDPRIARADALVGLQDKITPEWASMHKVGGDLPVECIEFTYSSFVSYAFSASFHVPNYTRYVAESDHADAFEWHEKILRLLQLTGRPHHWLLKGPTHLPVLPALFARYPDARIVLMLRDPVKATASVVDVGGTLFYMRSDNVALNKPHGQFIDGHPAVHALQRVIDWIEGGTIPRERIHPLAYLDFFADPEGQLEDLYARLGLSLDKRSKRAMLSYLESKPRDKFGRHEYELGDSDLIASEREKWRAIQEYFGVRSEV